MSTLRFVQDEVRAWSADNFGEQPSWKPLLGIGEELGELQHHYLKRAQGIRTTEDHDAGIRDAVADILIYLCDFCAREDIDLDAQLAQTWHEVKQRNWRASPQDGTSGISTSVASTASECWLAGWVPTEGSPARYWTSLGLLVQDPSKATQYRTREEAVVAARAGDTIFRAIVLPSGEVQVQAEDSDTDTDTASERWLLGWRSRSTQKTQWLVVTPTERLLYDADRAYIDTAGSLELCQYNEVIAFFSPHGWLRAQPIPNPTKDSP